MLGQSSDVLAILKDWQNFPMLVRVDTAQALEHLEPFERHGAIGGENLGEQRAPQRMRMQYGAGPASTHDGKVESGLRRRQPISTDHARSFVNFQELVRVKRAFIQARRRNRQAQWLLAHHRAEISARSENPSALIKTPSDLCEGSSQILKASARFFAGDAAR